MSGTNRVRHSARGRAAASGAAATVVWAVLEPLDKRLFRHDYSDVAVLGKAVTRSRAWPIVGLAMHAANGAVFGLAYDALRRRRDVSAVQLALAEHVTLFPLGYLVDRRHPARGEAGLASLFSARAFAQATLRHAVFGAVLGRLTSAAQEGEDRWMAIVDTIEIARSPEDVFAYLDQLERHGEWQTQIVSVTRETSGPTGVGTRATDVRRVPGGKQSVTYEITEYDPPHRVAFRGVNGPVRPVGSVTVEPAGEGRSRLTLELDLQGHGLLGLLVAPLARSQSRKLVPEDQRRLKERLEAGA